MADTGVSFTLLGTEIVRPAIPMSYVVGVPQICTLGLKDALSSCGQKAELMWPSALELTSGLVMRVKVRAGYDDEGMYLTCEIEYGGVPSETLATVPESADELGPLFGLTPELIAGHIDLRIAEWEAEIAAGRCKAGPLASVLLELFDATPLLGKECRVLGHTGHPLCSGHFVAIDVWGRATVRTFDGSEREFAPEHAQIVSA